MATKPIAAGYTLPGYSEQPGVQACFAPQTYSSNGTPKETKPPKAPPKSPNSAPTTQMNGSSLPKPAQGVIYDTITDLNNLIPSSGCPIKLPVLMNKVQTKFKLLPEIEANRLKEWGEKLGEFIAPMVEEVTNFINALKGIMKEIEGYIKEITNLIKEINEWVTAVMDFVSFVMTLPAKLAQLVANCLSALMNGVQNYVSDSFKSFANGVSSGISTTVPTNKTTGTYSSNTITIKT